jgi:hypothetical protein
VEVQSLEAMQPRMSAFEVFVGSPAAPSVQQTTSTHRRKEAKKMKTSNSRIVGLDVHPDSFAGAILEGADPCKARVVSTSRRVALPLLEKWAQRHTQRHDVLVIEASGNAFTVAERLGAIKRKVVILDSHRAGKVGKTYCATDRVDAIKIARIYLSALSPLVWQPDQKTRERREVFSAYQAVVKEGTRLKQQIKAMLNEHCVRLESGFRLSHPSALGRLLARRQWTEAQRMLLHQLHSGLVGARARVDTLHTKLHKLATELGLPTIKSLGYETKEAFVQKKLYLLKAYP